VNRSEDQDLDTSILIQGWTPRAGVNAVVRELNGKDKMAANPFGSSDNVNIREKSINQGLWTDDVLPVPGALRDGDRNSCSRLSLADKGNAGGCLVGQ